MQIASLLSRIILPSVAYLALSYFSTSHKRLLFGKKTIFNIKCVFFKRFFFPEAFNIIRRIQRDRIIKIFTIHFSKNPQISNFMKIRPVGAKLFHADGKAGGQDMKKRIAAVVFFLLGDSTASKFYVSTFRNILLVHTTY